MKETDRIEGATWLQEFLKIRDQCNPIIHNLSQAEESIAPVGEVGALLEALDRLPAILNSMKQAPKPKHKKLRRYKKFEENALRAYIEACKCGLGAEGADRSLWAQGRLKRSAVAKKVYCLGMQDAWVSAASDFWIEAAKEASGFLRESTPSEKIIDELETTIVAHSISAAKQIAEAWPKLTGGKPMSNESNFMVRCEMLWFFLRMIDISAFSTAGPKIRDVSLDTIAEDAIQRMITTSFDSSHAKEGFDVKGFSAKMLKEALNDYNNAKSDYDQCSGFIGDDLENLDLSGRTILGRLSFRIASELGQQSNRGVLVFSAAVALEAYVQSRLTKRIEKAVNAGVGG